MDAELLLKILCFLVGAAGFVFGFWRWSASRVEAAEKRAADAEISALQDKYEKQQAEIEKIDAELEGLKQNMSEKFVRKEDWLANVSNVERKLDHVRKDLSEEMKGIHKLLMEKLTQ